MLKTAKQKLITIAEMAHRKIFGEEMSEEMRTFLGHLSWSFFGVFFCATLMFAINIIIARKLGPTEYGNYNLVLAIGGFMIVIMSFGFDNTAIKYISETTNNKIRNGYISNALYGLFLISIVIIILVAIFHLSIIKFFNAQSYLVWISLIYAVVFVFKTFFDGFIKALHNFSFQAKVKIVESILVFSIALGIFFFASNIKYYSFVIPLIVISFAIVMLFFWKFKGRIGRWDYASFLKTKNYHKLTLAVSFIGISIGSADKFFIAKILGIHELGIYSAYLFASTAIVSQMMLALNNVFFPMINRISNKRFIMKKIDRLMLVCFAPIVLFVSLMTFLILKLYGHQYSINWAYILILSVVSFLQILTTFYGAITSSSQEYFSFTSKVYFFKPLVIIGFYFLILKSNTFGLITIFLILFLSYLYDIINTKVALKIVKI